MNTGVAIPFSRESSDPESISGSRALQADSLLSEGISVREHMVSDGLIFFFSIIVIDEYCSDLYFLRMYKIVIFYFYHFFIH